jgi:predicted dehydrogenase
MMTTRRTFLMSATGAAAGAVFSGCSRSGPASRVRVAVIGLHGRGKAHIDGLLNVDNTEIAAVCDADTRYFGDRLKTIAEEQKTTPATFQDYRKLLEDKSIDAITIATPNHWHSLMAIHGCQAGKDVFVEKPCSHTVEEGRRLVQIARATKRIVQHGTQERGNKQRAIEAAAARSGKFGQLLIAKGYCAQARWSIGREKEGKPPKSLDYNLWLGPAPERPFHKNLHPYNWHWFWDFGGGDIANQGVHQMDICRWGVKDATLPQRVWSVGGRIGYDDQAETPNMMLSVLEFGSVLVVFETRGLVGNKQEHEEMYRAGYPEDTNNEFYTTEGRIFRGKFFPKGSTSGDTIRGFDPEGVISENHLQNWIDVIRSRDTKAMNAEIEVGHYSTSLCHLANISWRRGADEPQGGVKLPFAQPEVAASLEKIRANGAAAGVDLTSTKFRQGAVLNFDAATEKFVGDDQANALLSKTYRPEFGLPTV